MTGADAAATGATPGGDGRAPAGPRDGRAEGPPARAEAPRQIPGEVNGPKGPEPTRFGDWEKAGRCTDF